MMLSSTLDSVSKYNTIPNKENRIKRDGFPPPVPCSLLLNKISPKNERFSPKSNGFSSQGSQESPYRKPPMIGNWILQGSLTKNSNFQSDDSSSSRPLKNPSQTGIISILNPKAENYSQKDYQGLRKGLKLDNQKRSASQEFSDSGPVVNEFDCRLKSSFTNDQYVKTLEANLLKVRAEKMELESTLRASKVETCKEDEKLQKSKETYESGTDEKEKSKQKRENSNNNNNNTSSSYPLPSEFKSLWESFLNESLINSMSDFFAYPLTLANIVQELVLAVEKLVGDELSFKFQQIGQLLGIGEKETDSLRKNLSNVLQENYGKISAESRVNPKHQEKVKKHLHDKITQEFGVKIQLIEENEEIKPLLMERQELLGKVEAWLETDEFKEVIPALVGIILYAQLHEPPLRIPLSTYSQRDFSFVAYNKGEYHVVDGFPKDFSPCLVILPAPLRNKKVYGGLKPGVLILEEEHITDYVAEAVKEDMKNKTSKQSATCSSVSGDQSSSIGVNNSKEASDMTTRSGSVKADEKKGKSVFCHSPDETKPKKNVKILEEIDQNDNLDIKKSRRENEEKNDKEASPESIFQRKIGIDETMEIEQKFKNEKSFRQKSDDRIIQRYFIFSPNFSLTFSLPRKSRRNLSLLDYNDQIVPESLHVSKRAQERPPSNDTLNQSSFLDFSMNGVSRRKKSIESRNNSFHREEKLNESWVLSNLGLSLNRKNSRRDSIHNDLQALDSKNQPEKLKEYFHNALRGSQLTQKREAKNSASNSILEDSLINTGAIISPKYMGIKSVLNQPNIFGTSCRKSVPLCLTGNTFGSRNNSVFVTHDERAEEERGSLNTTHHSKDFGEFKKHGNNMLELIGAIDSLKTSVANLKSINKSQKSIGIRQDKPPSSKKLLGQPQIRKNTVSILGSIGNHSNYSSVQASFQETDKREIFDKRDKESRHPSSRESSKDQQHAWNTQKNTLSLKVQPDQRTMISGPVRNLHSILDGIGSKPKQIYTTSLGRAKERIYTSILNTSDASFMQSSNSKETRRISGEKEFKNPQDSRYICQQREEVKRKNHSSFKTFGCEKETLGGSDILRLGRKKNDSIFKE